MCSVSECGRLSFSLMHITSTLWDDCIFVWVRIALLFMVCFRVLVGGPHSFAALREFWCVSCVDSQDGRVSPLVKPAENIVCL